MKIYPFEYRIRVFWLIIQIVQLIISLIVSGLFMLGSSNPWAVILPIFAPSIFFLSYYCIYDKFGTQLIGFFILIQTFYFLINPIRNTESINFVTWLMLISEYLLNISVYIVNQRIRERYFRSTETYKNLKEQWTLIQDSKELYDKYIEARQSNPESTQTIKLAYKDTKILVF